MKHYIDKATVVAEIERIKKEECPVDSYEGRCKLLWFEQFLSFLDTLEVKEVDLEDDVDKILEENDWNFDEIDFYQFAKHFFELGLKAQKGK